MKMHNQPYIVIEGNIGAGKTSLSRLLSEEIGANLILETFEENPFLALFYQQQERYSLPVELFFMAERQKQLQDWLFNSNLMQPLVADYIFSKTLIFAKENLSGHEWDLFKRLFHSLNNNFPKPDLLVYLHRPVGELLANIKKRNRSYEQNIPADYLQRVESSYMEFFQKHQHEIPILIVDAENCDFVNDESHYEQVRKLIGQKYQVGIHRYHFQHDVV